MSGMNDLVIVPELRALSVMGSADAGIEVIEAPEPEKSVALTVPVTSSGVVGN